MQKNNITLSSKNIIPFLNNLISHFTEKRGIIILSLVILMWGFISIIFNDVNTFALSYSGNINMDFTFNPTIAVNLSSADLTIANLIPGGISDSNSIDVSVATNSAYGYTLAVNVASEDLVNSSSVNVFSSIATDAELESLADSESDNIWGYATKFSGNNAWSNYNGLSSSNNITLLDIDDNSADTINFKIAAKASNIQPSGNYTGTIKFIAVTKPTPMNLSEAYFAAGKTRYKGYYKMQDMT